MKYIGAFFIRMYQLIISPVYGHCCRFEPTCSEYAKQAFLLHGTWKGGILTAKRLCRCHPWGKSGYDPVPKPIKRQQKNKGKR